MNQRQKKKSSQHRKRHFDAVKARESGHSSGGQKQHSKEQAKPQTVPTSQPQLNQVQARDVAPVAVSPVDSNVPPGDQRKTFSKRKVVSNWEKYDQERLEDESGSLQESEEALKDRLLQLFNLPITHTMPSLTDIGDDQISSSMSNAAQELDEGSDFLTLDCRALAEALSTLPLHERLDIDPELFPEEHGGVDLKTNMDSSSLPSSKANQSKNDALDLTQSLKKFSEKPNTDNRIECDSSLMETVKQTVTPGPMKPVASTEASKHTISANLEDEERELDKLLSRKSEVKSSCENTKVTLSLKSEEDTHSSTSVASTEIKSLMPTTTVEDEETTELDDMLDELLDS